MTTSNSPVNHDDCLALLAELGRRSLAATEADDDTSSSTFPELRQTLDNAMRLKEWGQPDVLDSLEDLYTDALGNPDANIAVGLMAYLDYLAGVQVPYVNSEGKAITFGVVCAADVTHFEGIGAFADVSRLTDWIAGHLGVPAANLIVHPTPGLPETIFDGLYEFTTELGRAMSKPLPEEYVWNFSTQSNPAYASDIVFWVSYSSDSAEELQRVADRMSTEVPDEKMTLITLPFKMADGAGELEILPCAVQWPFSAFVQAVFNPVLDSLEDTVYRLEERGYPAESMTAELTISLEEDNLYGFDESFVIDLRDEATGFILARVPGFHAGLLEMFRPFFIEEGLDLDFASLLVRPGNGEPTKRYVCEDDE